MGVVTASSQASEEKMSTSTSRIGEGGTQVPTLAIDGPVRPVQLLDVIGGASTEGTVFPKMTDIDGFGARLGAGNVGAR